MTTPIVLKSDLFNASGYTAQAEDIAEVRTLFMRQAQAESNQVAVRTAQGWRFRAIIPVPAE